MWSKVIYDSKMVDRVLIDRHIVDSGLVDSGVVDSGVVDSGVVDSGLVDSGVVDSGVVIPRKTEGYRFELVRLSVCPSVRLSHLMVGTLWSPLLY